MKLSSTNLHVFYGAFKNLGASDHETWYTAYIVKIINKKIDPFQYFFPNF